MTVMTPEHWNGETQALAAKLATHQASPTLEERALFAIATELADLRKVLETPPEETVVSVEPRELPTAALEALIREHAAKSGMPADLLPKEHETSGFALHRAMPENERTAYDRAAIITGHANIKLVGWYCPGGHPLPSKMRSGQSLDIPAREDMAISQPNVRSDDPCEYAVPMYVLVK